MGPLRGTRVSLLLALVGAMLAPSAAGATTHTLRPDTIASGAGTWNVNGAAYEWAVLDDPVFQPAVPSTPDDYLYQNAAGPQTVQLGLSNATIATGQSVTSATVWTYAETGTGRSVTVVLRTAFGLLGIQNIPAGSPAAWRSIDVPLALTQAQLDDLRVQFTLNGSGATTDTFVYAAYADVAQTDPAPVPDPTPDPTPEPTPDPTPAPDPTPDPQPTPEPTPEPTPDPALADLPIDVVGRSVVATPDGVLPITLTCTAEETCVGTITIEESADARALIAARRRFGSKRYRVKRGKTATIPVRLDRRVYRRYRRRRSFKVDVVIAQKDATGTVRQERRTIRAFNKKKKKRKTRR